jgi:xanthine dehydrogenase accessory factor
MAWWGVLRSSEWRVTLLEDVKVLVRGGGDLASGVVYRLNRAGMQVMVVELAQPLVIRRAVAFASAVYEDTVEIDGIVGRKVASLADALAVVDKKQVPVLVDPQGEMIVEWQPTVVVDAILAKKNLGTKISDAPIVIGLGPGFEAGVDAHAVVETKRGHYLGRVLLEGSAAPDTGVPGDVLGYTLERVLRAPQAGIIHASKQIGDTVEAGDAVALVDGTPVVAKIGGVIRGLLADGLSVTEGMKVGDVDPRGVRDHCFTISDKALAIGGGVLEAVLYLSSRLSV